MGQNPTQYMRYAVRRRRVGLVGCSQRGSGFGFFTWDYSVCRPGTVSECWSVCKKEITVGLSTGILGRRAAMGFCASIFLLRTNSLHFSSEHPQEKTKSDSSTEKPGESAPKVECGGTVGLGDAAALPRSHGENRICWILHSRLWKNF